MTAALVPRGQKVRPNAAAEPLQAMRSTDRGVLGCATECTRAQVVLRQQYPDDQRKADWCGRASTGLAGGSGAFHTRFWLRARMRG